MIKRVCMVRLEGSEYSLWVGRGFMRVVGCMSSSSLICNWVCWCEGFFFYYVRLFYFLCLWFYDYWLLRVVWDGFSKFNGGFFRVNMLVKIGILFYWYVIWWCMYIEIILD